jgi:hypothetical protein
MTTQAQNPVTALEEAVHEILDLYARLRQNPAIEEKTALLRRATERASVIADSLQAIATAPNMHALDSKTARTLKEMAPLMEQILVQEREYRRATAGHVEEEQYAANGGAA